MTQNNVAGTIEGPVQRPPFLFGSFRRYLHFGVRSQSEMRIARKRKLCEKGGTGPRGSAGRVGMGRAGPAKNISFWVKGYPVWRVATNSLAYERLLHRTKIA